jgi:hypothetical protein
MARALFGYVGTPTQQEHDMEIARLRATIRDLHAEISELRAEAAARRHLDADRELARDLESAGRQTALA